MLQTLTALPRLHARRVLNLPSRHLAAQMQAAVCCLVTQGTQDLLAAALRVPLASTRTVWEARLARLALWVTYRYQDNRAARRVCPESTLPFLLTTVSPVQLPSTQPHLLRRMKPRVSFVLPESTAIIPTAPTDMIVAYNARPIALAMLVSTLGLAVTMS